MLASRYALNKGADFREAAMARKTAYAMGETQSVFFRACDITKPEPPVLRHGGPCFDWGRATLVALCFVFCAGLATLAYASLS